MKLRSAIAMALLMSANTALAQGAPGTVPVKVVPPANAIAPQPQADDSGTYERTIMVMDGIHAGLFVVGTAGAFACAADNDNGCVLWVGAMAVGIPLYTLGPAVVHGRHGHFGRAAVSVLARTTLPVFGLMGGFESGDGEKAVAGFLAGMAAAKIADWVMASRPATRLVPVAAPNGRGGTTFGVAGSF